MDPDSKALKGEEHRLVSSNEIDYAKFVLYTRRGVPACEHLIRLASRCSDVIVQDVDKISGARPEWLRGVPSLIELPDFKLHTGTQALQIMESHVKTGIQGLSVGLVGGLQAGSAGAPLSEDDDLSQGRFGLAISSDDRYEDAPRDRNQGGASLEDMMRIRASSQKELQQQ